MKLERADFMILPILVAIVGAFYVERVWDAHGWSRNSLGYVFIPAFGVVLFAGWAWERWGKRNSK